VVEPGDSSLSFALPCGRTARVPWAASPWLDELEVDMRAAFLAVVGLSVLVAGGRPALADVKVGDAAPGFRGKEFVNTDPLLWEDLRGRVLLYEIFRTW
jgi:hypothetical protein